MNGQPVRKITVFFDASFKDKEGVEKQVRQSYCVGDNAYIGKNKEYEVYSIEERFSEDGKPYYVVFAAHKVNKDIIKQWKKFDPNGKPVEVEYPVEI